MHFKIQIVYFLHKSIIIFHDKRVMEKDKW